MNLTPQEKITLVRLISDEIDNRTWFGEANLDHPAVIKLKVMKKKITDNLDLTVGKHGWMHP